MHVSLLYYYDQYLSYTILHVSRLYYYDQYLSYTILHALALMHFCMKYTILKLM